MIPNPRSRCLAFALALGLFPVAGWSQPPLALVPVGKIALPNTQGRIDHMAIDLGRQRLFVAELGNGTVDVVDLPSGKVIRRLTKLRSPQGIAYDPKADLLAVASDDDGSLRIYAGSDLAPRGVVMLGDDADNVRIDPRNGNVLVGYGSGGLAIIDPARAQKLRDIPLPAHPESLRQVGNRVFVNIPGASQIAVIDLDAGKIVATWRMPGLSSNFPMIMDNGGHLAVVFRGQNQLALIDPNSGNVATTIGVCGDADDLFFDEKRRRFYVSCGAGSVDVIADEAGNLHALARIQTLSGARTSLFVPELDRLFVAERAAILGSSAAILILQPH
jgi:DNA-binding beta-propeller fold protein YncE